MKRAINSFVFSYTFMVIILNYYLIGIKGSAMSALAKILYQEGHIVAGVDVEDNFYTFKESLGIRLESFHNMHLKKGYFYIIGNAFMNHRVTEYIKEQGWKFQSYPQFLVHHFKHKNWITISGTHGKTTSTKLLSTILSNTTSLIGDGDYTFGNSPYFLLEACEYRDTFLNYKPHISLILNVDYDHVDYFKTQKDYIESFKKYAMQSSLCVVNGDSFSYRAENMITFGLKPDNDIVFTYENGKITILNKAFYFPIKGLQYAYDFVGVYIIAKLLDKKDHFIQQRLEHFKMPKRRYQKYCLKDQTIILDYAHHPNEIRAIYNTLQEEYPDEIKICVFEPHTLSRLSAFSFEFKQILSLFDYCYLFDLFSSAREHHDQMKEQALYEQLGFEAYSADKILLKKGVVCFLGAGDIDKGCINYLKKYNLIHS